MFILTISVEIHTFVNKGNNKINLLPYRMSHSVLCVLSEQLDLDFKQTWCHVINVYIISERRSLFFFFFFFFNFFNIAPLTCALELTSSNSYFNSYCKHLSLRSTLSKYLEILDYLLCSHRTTFIDLHRFSREKWISLFEVGSKPSNKNSVLYSV